MNTPEIDLKRQLIVGALDSKIQFYHTSLEAARKRGDVVTEGEKQSLRECLTACVEMKQQLSDKSNSIANAFLMASVPTDKLPHREA